MRENYEIEKELKFNNNIAEVTSISLEEKHDIEDDIFKGNFIVSGEYRIHEISVNKESFSYKIPFEHRIKSDIDINSLELDVVNFTYDTDGDTLFATITYDLVGDRKDILLFDDKEDLEDFLKSREVEVIIDETIDEIDNVLENDKEVEVIKELDEIIEENKEIKVKEKIEDIKEQVNEGNLKDDRNMEVSKEKLLNSVNVNDDNYITYKIHIVKSEDSLESILIKYNMSLEELKEYNDFTTLQLGDKLIIPIVNEE